MDTDTIRRIASMYNQSQAYWRTLEISKLMELKKVHDLKSPVLEIGCGDGRLSGMVFEHIDHAIDINPRSVEKARQTGTFGSVYCMDAHQMEFEPESFATVFSNCVLEHIPNLLPIISEFYRVLYRDGIVITTVPLVDMEKHMFIRSTWYTMWRRKKLHHVNLLSLEQWKALFLEVGFKQVESYPYMGETDCYQWDRMDFVGTIGMGRFTLSTGYQRLRRSLPKSIRAKLYGRSARIIAARLAGDPITEPCATALIAYKERQI